MRQRVFGLAVCFLSICLFLLAVAFKQPAGAQVFSSGDFDLSSLNSSSMVLKLNGAAPPAVVGVITPPE